MVAGASVEHSQVDVGPGTGGESLEEVFHQLRLKVPDPLSFDRRLQYEIGTAAQVDGRHRQRFVHGHHKVAGAVDASFVAERLPKGLAQHKASVFNGVMLIDVQIAPRPEVEI